GATQPRSGDGTAEQPERPRFVGRVASVNDDPVQPTNLLADSGNRPRRDCWPFQGSSISVRLSHEGQLLGNPIAGKTIDRQPGTLHERPQRLHREVDQVVRDQILEGIVGGIGHLDKQSTSWGDRASYALQHSDRLGKMLQGMHYRHHVKPALHILWWTG